MGAIYSSSDSVASFEAMILSRMSDRIIPIVESTIHNTIRDLCS